MNSLAFGGKHFQAIAPAASAASATTNGTSIDAALLQHKEGMFVAQLGASTGTPTGISVAFQVQDSANNSSWANVTDPGLVENSGLLTLTDVNTIGRIAFRPKGLRRYRRLTQVNALTGGSSPTILAAADCYLYGPERTP